MKKFMDKDFILENKTAVKLFEYANTLPIIDYHCHLNPAEIANDRHFDNITQMWLGGDHYKWRAMRSCGVDEKFITGDTDDFDKFVTWTKTVPYLIGNPLLHWTYLELKRFFGIDEIICEKNAKYIWDKANEKIKDPSFSARGLIKKSNVELICTTDDPIDTLEHHKAIAEDTSFATKVLPAFRPDKALTIGKDTFIPYIEKIKTVSGSIPASLEELKNVMLQRIDFFEKMGCKVSDHGFEGFPNYRSFAIATDDAADAVFKKKMAGKALTQDEIDIYMANMLVFFGREYAKKGWVMQLHLASMRNNNAIMYSKLGPDTGYDSIDDCQIAWPLSRFLDTLDKDGLLPKTVLYSLNPKDNAVIGSMLGNFQSKGDVSKMQFGSAWWFNDHKDGMEEQMRTLANLGALSKFIGMLTDSRSFLSYTRHEYFRRILCNIVGTWVENGEYPCDMDMLKEIVGGISYENVKKYLGVL